MLTEIQSVLTEALQALNTFKDVGVWQGDLDDATKNPARLPAAWVVFSGCTFGRPRTIGATVAPSDIGFTVVVIARNPVNPGKAAPAVYELTEQALAAITGLDTGHGWCWPESCELISIERGIIAYALTIGIRTNP